MSKISFLKLKDALIAETYNDNSLSDGDTNFEVDDNEIINVNFVYYRDKKFGSEFNKYKHNFQYLIPNFLGEESAIFSLLDAFRIFNEAKVLEDRIFDCKEEIKIIEANLIKLYEKNKWIKQDRNE